MCGDTLETPSCFLAERTVADRRDDDQPVDTLTVTQRLCERVRIAGEIVDAEVAGQCCAFEPNALVLCEPRTRHLASEPVGRCGTEIRMRDDLETLGVASTKK